MCAEKSLEESVMIDLVCDRIKVRSRMFFLRDTDTDASDIIWDLTSQMVTQSAQRVLKRTQ